MQLFPPWQLSSLRSAAVEDTLMQQRAFQHIHNRRDHYELERRAAAYHPNY